MRYVIVIILAIILIACGDKEMERKAKYFYRANDHLDRKEFQQAIKYYREAILVDRDFKDAYNNLGIAYYEQGKYFDAIEQYSHAIQIDSVYYDAYLNRANAFIENQSWQRALNDLLKVEPVYYDSSYVHFSLGIVYNGLKQFDQSLASFNKFISLDPDNIEAFINRATVYYQMKRWSAAKSDVEKAFEMNPNESNAYNLLGLIAIDEEKYDIALNYFNQALSYQDNNPFYLNNRGLAYLKLDKMDSALADINKSIVLKSDNPWSIRNKGIYYLKTKEYDNAIRLFEQAIRMDEKVGNLFFYLGSAYWKKGLKSKACVTFSAGQQFGDSLAMEQVTTVCK